MGVVGVMMGDSGKRDWIENCRGGWERIEMRWGGWRRNGDRGEGGKV